MQAKDWPSGETAGQTAAVPAAAEPVDTPTTPEFSDELTVTLQPPAWGCM